MTSLVVIGTGGHARETRDVAVAAIDDGAAPVDDIAGFLSDAPPDERFDGTYLGRVDPAALAHHRFVIAVGQPAARRELADRLSSRCRQTCPPLVHPLASAGTDVDLAPGTIVAAGARLTTHVTVGAHTHLNPNVVVSHDCRLGRFVSCSPGVVLSGDVTVGDGVLLGSGAVVLPGRRIGADAVVGAGAVVTDDVAAGAVVVGVPARPTDQH